MKTKVCKHCGMEKSLELFAARKGMTDGHLNDCILCSNLKAREHMRLIRTGVLTPRAKKILAPSNFDLVDHELILMP